MNENIKTCISRRTGKCKLLPNIEGWGCKLVIVPITDAHSQEELFELVKQAAVRTGAIECPYFDLSHCRDIVKGIDITN